MMDCLRDPVFYVGELNEDIDCSLPPSSGEEYIKRVVLEARQCPDVVVADVDRTRFQNPTIDVEPLPGCVKAPESLGPTLDWRKLQMEDFINVHGYVSLLKEQIKLTGPIQGPPLVDLPDVDDPDSWVIFCTERCGDSLRNPPTLQTVFSFSQLMVEKVLTHLVTKAVMVQKIEYELGLWIYALLILLEPPLTPDITSCLRHLARSCSVIRASSRQVSLQERGIVNLFILLVGWYFKQQDLADP